LSTNEQPTIEELNARIDALESELGEARDELGDAKSELDKANERISELEGEVEARNPAIEALMEVAETVENANGESAIEDLTVGRNTNIQLAARVALRAVPK
jgi:chromosome segregation ATPase